MSIDSCGGRKKIFQDIILEIQQWEKEEDGRLKVRAMGDFRGKAIGLEALIHTEMKPVEYNPVTGLINIVDPATVYPDGITLRSIGVESNHLVEAMAETYDIALSAYEMAKEIPFTVLCLENENNDLDEFCQKYQLMIDEVEGKETYGELFMNIDIDMGSLIISESDAEYRKSILSVFTGSGTTLNYWMREAKEGLESYFNSIGNKMKLAKLNMRLAAIGKSSVRINTIPMEESRIPIGASKFGGRPDLPADFHWPEWKGMSLSFIGQLNMEDLHKHPGTEILPNQGILYFFYDAADQTVWGFDPDDKGSSRVVYANMKPEQLKRWDFPEDLPEDYRYDAGVLKLSSEDTIPSLDSVFLEELELSEQELETYVMLEDSKAKNTEDCTVNRILGYPDTVAGEMETLCALVNHGQYCGGPVEIEEDQVDFYMNEAKEWRLLLQVDSLEKLGFMWGDGGRIYFWIKREDLANMDFTKIWLVKQSN